MNRKVEFVPAARADLVRLIEFIADRNPRAAARLSTFLREHTMSLSEFSERGRPGPVEGLRELIVRFGRSRYIIRYQVREDAVVITRIWHGRERR